MNRQNMPWVLLGLTALLLLALAAAIAGTDWPKWLLPLAVFLAAFWLVPLLATRARHPAFLLEPMAPLESHGGQRPALRP